MTRSDGEVNKDSEGTLCDIYLNWYASNYIYFWTDLPRETSQKVKTKVQYLRHHWSG